MQGSGRCGALDPSACSVDSGFQGGSDAQEAAEWESPNGEILDLFFEERVLSVLRFEEEMKLGNYNLSGCSFCGNRGRKESKTCVDFQEFPRHWL